MFKIIFGWFNKKRFRGKPGLSFDEWISTIVKFETENDFPVTVHLEGKSGYQLATAFFEVSELYRQEVNHIKEEYLQFFKTGGVARIQPSYEQASLNIPWFSERCFVLLQILRPGLTEEENNALLKKAMPGMMNVFSDTNFYSQHIADFRLYNKYFEYMERLYGDDTTAYTEYKSFCRLPAHVLEMNDTGIRQWLEKNRHAF